MILTSLRLRDFRGYERLDLTFDPKRNFLVGPNAAGKTNLAEAIHYLSLARSFRTQEDGNLIREGKDAAYIEAEVVEGSFHRVIGIEIGKQKKRITLNGKPLRRLSELSKVVNVIAFVPADAAIFYGSPGERRNYLDIGLSKQSEDYFRLISRFNGLLKQRNAALKRTNPDRLFLQTLTEQLIDVSEPIVRYRSMFVASLNAELPGLLAKLRGDSLPCEIVYRSFVKDDGHFRENAQKAYDDALEGDLIRKSTSIGLQREDFSFRLKGKDISEFGSQGENRMAALALKLCPYLLIEDPDKKPICVLDDVLSELDQDHRERLLHLLGEWGQTFLTATETDIHGETVIDISAHTTTRRNVNGR